MIFAPKLTGLEQKSYWTDRSNIVKYPTVQQPIAMRNFANGSKNQLSHIIRNPCLHPVQIKSLISSYQFISNNVLIILI